ncbi:MAG: heparinase II/III-family protein [Gemmatimonadetes bacterium]|nr:heparinase II/III-family protein [Gemmatimonadota bacterium]
MPGRRQAFTRLTLTSVIALVTAAPLHAHAPREVPIERVRQEIQDVRAGHPRLLVDAGTFATLRERVRHDARAGELYRVLHTQAVGMLALPPVQHVVVGRRLLNESRKAVRRVMTLAMVYRLSGEERFLQGARREMLAAASFPNWNPSHFLDTAEMSLAVAIGYDWLFDALSPADRTLIRQALLDKGIRASFEHGQCFVHTNNWGQVCTAGISAAALAVLEDDRELATRVVHRAVNGVPNSMKASFAPDGTYPEGPAYWDYGTSFNAILIAELESVLGTDFGLSGAEGFDRTAAFINHATGPTGLFFNYADGSSSRGPLPVLQWFAGRYQRGDWLLFENRMMSEWLRSPEAAEVGGSSERLLPLALLWMPAELPAGGPGLGLHWLGRGEIAVAMHRTSWEPDALFVGIKAGFAAGPHGQMDAGSFVLDADGERWAHDLGAESYNRIEERGMNLWNRTQGSDRWRVFRNNNLSHSTLVIGGKHQDVQGKATVIKHVTSPVFPRSVVDLTPAYTGQAARVLRGVGIVNGGEVLVQDRLEGVTGGPVRWGMVTRAMVEIRGPREAVLRQGGKLLTLRVLAPASARLQLFDSERPPAEHDSPNPGTRMIGFTVDAAGAPVELVVRLTPGSAAATGARELPVTPLAAW